MSRIERTSFRRNLHGFLGSTWLSRSTAAAQIERVSKSFSADPVDPPDSIFPSLSENYQSPDHLAGFQSVTRQLLANDVLGSLIQAQSDMLRFDSLLPFEPDMASAQAAEAYRFAGDKLADNRVRHAG